MKNKINHGVYSICKSKNDKARKRKVKVNIKNVKIKMYDRTKFRKGESLTGVQFLLCT